MCLFIYGFLFSTLQFGGLLRGGRTVTVIPRDDDLSINFGVIFLITYTFKICGSCGRLYRGEHLCVCFHWTSMKFTMTFIQFEQ